MHEVQIEPAEERCDEYRQLQNDFEQTKEPETVCRDKNWTETDDKLA